MRDMKKTAFGGLVLVGMIGLNACSSEVPRVYADGYGYSDKERGAPVARGLNGGGSGYVVGSVDDFVVNIGDRVFFDFDDARLSMEAKQILNRQADWLKTRPAYSVRIEGHCDERGSRAYNYRLGQERADVVRKYLVSRGLDAKNITTISYGEERPAVHRSDEAAWAENRRAVTALGQKK